ncbi:MAG: protealysin inhibitor emfourin [Anaerolineales bacterium]
MTKIFFERTGGFMGRKVNVTIETDDLPDDQAELLNDLVNDAGFFELPADLTKLNMPDSFTYNITISSDERQHSVRVSDTTAPDDLRPLLDELSRQARMQR